MNLMTVTAELLLAIGDAPGGSPRSYATQDNKSPDMNRLARIEELISGGLVSADEVEYHGRSVRRLSLTMRGQLAYTLLRGVRDLLKEGSP